MAKNKTQTYRIELINMASCIIEVKAKSFEQAQKKAFKRRNECAFNYYNTDCTKIIINQTIAEIDNGDMINKWRTDIENIPEYIDLLMYVGVDEPRPYFIEENATLIIYGGTSKINGVTVYNERFFSKILAYQIIDKPILPINKNQLPKGIKGTKK